jgi:hypothetical protein
MGVDASVSFSSAVPAKVFFLFLIGDIAPVEHFFGLNRLALVRIDL